MVVWEGDLLLSIPVVVVYNTYSSYAVVLLRCFSGSFEAKQMLHLLFGEMKVEVDRVNR